MRVKFAGICAGIEKNGNLIFPRIILSIKANKEEKKHTQIDNNIKDRIKDYNIDIGTQKKT